jgi:hypothetical protein
MQNGYSGDLKQSGTIAQVMSYNVISQLQEEINSCRRIALGNYRPGKIRAGHVQGTVRC